MGNNKIKGGEVGSVKALRKSLKRSAGGGQYIKTIPEEGINVRFLTEPDKFVEYFEHYDEDHEPRYYPCSEDCEGCDMNLSKSKRYLANALDLDDGNKVVPIKIPASLMSRLLKRFDKFETLTDRDYELSKEGSGMDTEYSEAYESPSKRNVKKYELIGLWELLEQQLNPDDDDDDDDDEPPAKSPRRGGAAKKIVKRRQVEEDDDEDDEDERPIKKVVKKSGSRPVKKSISKKPIRKIKK